LSLLVLDYKSSVEAGIRAAEERYDMLIPGQPTQSPQMTPLYVLPTVTKASGMRIFTVKLELISFRKDVRCWKRHQGRLPKVAPDQWQKTGL